MRKAESRQAPTGYIERHHVFPVSIYGKNKRVVPLTAKEHYIAHLLIHKAFELRYGKNHCKTQKMLFAIFLMRGKSRKSNSFMYQKAREKLSVIRKGSKRSKQFCEKLSKLMTGKKRGPLTKEAKAKLSASRLGKILSLEAKQKISQTRENNSLNREYILTRPDGSEFWSNNLNRVCRENGLCQSNMACILSPSHHAKTHRGWKVRYA